MKDKILYHLKTARAYLSLAQSMRSEYYYNAGLEQLALAHALYFEYKLDETHEYKLAA